MTELLISVDIETSGPIIGRHSMLSLGACLVDDVAATFARTLQPISAEAEPAAMQIIGRSLDDFTKSGMEVSRAMREFAAWIGSVRTSHDPVFVGFNAAFDWGFVNWYFLTYVGENPFGIAPLDIKAYYAGLTGVEWKDTRSSKIPERFKPISRHTHDPLEDAIEQAAMFARMRTAYRPSL